jgi:hypothetical protein
MSIVTDILKKPSSRTQMESSMTGISVLMIGSLALVIYLISTGVITGFWYISLIILSELGILSFQFSLLSTTYQTYRQYKLEMGLYPIDYVLTQQVNEAKKLLNELDITIKKVEEENKQVLNQEVENVFIQ